MGVATYKTADEMDEELMKVLPSKEQLEKYKNTEEIKMIPNIRCYSVVVIKDELIVEEV